MASDRVVTAAHVLRAVLRLRRQGGERVMQELEQVEPDLASYLMEELSLVHSKLLDLGASAKRTRWVVRRTEAIALVCVAALRAGHLDLWRSSSAADGPLAELRGSVEEPNPPEDVERPDPQGD